MSNMHQSKASETWFPSSSSLCLYLLLDGIEEAKGRFICLKPKAARSVRIFLAGICKKLKQVKVTALREMIADQP